mmetsp:Transcript_104361/g.164668  ORF Transcript_104361/g.164668 Transcript_104361/m.164668 type:complete len:239 (-) Transcript_104361:37-753(-)
MFLRFFQHPCGFRAILFASLLCSTTWLPFIGFHGRCNNKLRNLGVSTYRQIVLLRAFAETLSRWMERCVATEYLGYLTAIHGAIASPTEAHSRKLGSSFLLHPWHHAIQNKVPHRIIPAQFLVPTTISSTTHCTSKACEASERNAILRRIAHNRILPGKVWRHCTIAFISKHITKLFVPASVDPKHVLEDNDSVLCSLRWPCHIAFNIAHNNHVPLRFVICHYKQRLSSWGAALRHGK